jgi:hypothetical protein
MTVTSIKTSEVRDLYAAADHYAEGHPRQARNRAEFDAWLAAHDAALARDLWAKFEQDARQADNRLWSASRKVDELISARVEAAKITAEAAGLTDDETPDAD